MARFSVAAARDEFVTRAATLSDLLAVARTAGLGLERSAGSEYCIVQLQDTWTRFVRELIVRSSLGHAERGDGSKLAAGAGGVITFSDAMAALRTSWPGGKRPPYWEPSWFDQGHSANALAILQPVNANDIGAALGAGTNPIEELRGVRNFVCHRGPTSAPKIASSANALGVGWEQPSDIVNAFLGGTTVFDTWIARFSAVATSATK